MIGEKMSIVRGRRIASQNWVRRGGAPSRPRPAELWFRRAIKTGAYVSRITNAKVVVVTAAFD